MSKLVKITVQAQLGVLFGLNRGKSLFSSSSEDGEKGKRHNKMT